MNPLPDFVNGEDGFENLVLLLLLLLLLLIYNLTADISVVEIIYILEGKIFYCK